MTNIKRVAKIMIVQEIYNEFYNYVGRYQVNVGVQLGTLLQTQALFGLLRHLRHLRRSLGHLCHSIGLGAHLPYHFLPLLQIVLTQFGLHRSCSLYHRRCCSGCSRRGSRHDTRVCMGRLQERRAIIVGKSTKLWYTNLKVFFCIAVGVKRNQFKHKENTPKI